ncbi:hypothetical protein [Magnetococcus sp. PR-3]|uniref:hypothetical protein n=1 Tax=Magnetococcus sp. PR-3 TaxID=3120355 RepID=UPI002FCE61E7
MLAVVRVFRVHQGHTYRSRLLGLALGVGVATFSVGAHAMDWGDFGGNPWRYSWGGMPGGMPGGFGGMPGGMPGGFGMNNPMDRMMDDFNPGEMFDKDRDRGRDRRDRDNWMDRFTPDRWMGEKRRDRRQDDSRDYERGRYGDSYYGSRGYQDPLDYPDNRYDRARRGYDRGYDERRYTPPPAGFDDRGYSERRYDRYPESRNDRGGYNPSPEPPSYGYYPKHQSEPVDRGNYGGYDRYPDQGSGYRSQSPQGYGAPQQSPYDRQGTSGYVPSANPTLPGNWPSGSGRNNSSSWSSQPSTGTYSRGSGNPPPSSRLQYNGVNR